MDERGRRRRGGSIDSQLDGAGQGESVTAAASGPGGKRRKIQAERVNRIRDDLSLDAFQRNYTSEDNASFVQIVAQENKQRKEDRWGWAWEAQAKAEQRKIEWEDKRKAVLDAATSGQWRVDGHGRRMIGGLAQGGSEQAEGKAWSGEGPRLMLTAASADGAGASAVGADEQIAQGLVDGMEAASGNASGALVKHAAASTSSALIRADQSLSSSSAKDKETLDEVVLPEHHPLGRALVEAGLPATALVSKEDGVLVPMRETASGYGDGRGRGKDEVDRRRAAEKAVMGDEEKSHLALGGSGAEGWGFKVCLSTRSPCDTSLALAVAVANPV
jgi:protein DGCR14